MKPIRQYRNSSRTNGFTLIEIMMVVAILGLTLVMGLPSFLRVMQKSGMHKAEYEMVEACKEARRSAIMNNQTASLILHPVQGTFEVPGAFPQAQLPGEVHIETLGVNFVESRDFDQATVHFFPNGTSDEFTIILHAAGGATLEIDLDTISALPVLKDIR
jgi:prepilin-type N-terminal cleavage/methylation domain-containing protein